MGFVAATERAQTGHCALNAAVLNLLFESDRREASGDAAGIVWCWLFGLATVCRGSDLGYRLVNAAELQALELRQGTANALGRGIFPVC